MNEKKKELINKISNVFILLFMAYPFGLILGAIFKILEAFKVIRIQNADRLPIGNLKRILIVNHPSVIDPFLAAVLFLREYLLHPLTKNPVVMADKSLFFDPWYFWGLRPVIIPVERGDRRKEATSFLKVVKAVEEGHPVIIFPEGGRTFKGVEGEFLCSLKGKKIRPFKGGIGLLALKTKSLVIPAWIEGSDKVVPNSRKTLWTGFVWWKLFKKGITIKIGHPINVEKFSDKNREVITQEIVISLLRLADEEE
jgi:1-acyl-sn-glycerol-3-phosphate acyltransferase